MAVNYDIAYHWTRPAKGSPKTGWTTIGTAFQNEDGSIKLCFMAVPVPGTATFPGEYMLYPKTLKTPDRAAAQDHE